jgi:hypothetical protein
MPAKTQGYSFIMRDGTVLLAHEPGRAWDDDFLDKREALNANAD